MFSDCPTRCPICERPLDSPVRLPCGHMLCDMCVTEILMCSQNNCDFQIPHDYKYQPEQDKIE